MPLFGSRLLLELSFKGSDVLSWVGGFLLFVTVCFSWLEATLAWVISCVALQQGRLVFELYVGSESSSDSLVETGVHSFRSGLLLKLSFVGVGI